MRKLSNTRSLRQDDDQPDAYATDTRQRRIAGATITARPESHAIDAFFARHRFDVTVTGAAAGAFAPAGGQAGGQTGGQIGDIVSLSDGTQILFATARQVSTAKPA
ncbi:MAG TPA: hypothetical protein VFG12_12410 [Rhodopila sp.]|nr:hypothetical protein [Rhodopila sp.]